MTDRPTPEHWEIVLDNMGLVYRQVNKLPFHRREDAEQDGVFGLVRAAQLYDPDLGYKFSTYANWHIRNAIADGRGRSLTMSDRVAMRSGESTAPIASLDVPVTDDHTSTLGDTIADDCDPYRPVDDELRAADLQAALQRLGGGRHEHDQAILGELLTWDRWSSGSKLAEQCGVSRQRIGQRLKKLRALIAESGVLDV